MHKHFWLVLVTILTGCSTTRFSSNQLETTTRYVVATPATLEFPAVLTVFDLVGAIPLLGLAKTGRDFDVGKRLGAALQIDGLNIADEMRSQLERELAAVKVETGRYSAPRRPPLVFASFANPAELPRGQPSQSFLDMSLRYGFVAQVSGADYEPYLIVNVQVVAADTHVIKYKKSFLHNFTTLKGADIKVEPAATTTWKNVAAIEADIPGATAAFRSAMTDVAKKIVDQLQTDISLAPTESP